MNGIWHTAIVVYGKEYFYGSQGIDRCHPVSAEICSLVGVFKPKCFSYVYYILSFSGRHNTWSASRESVTGSNWSHGRHFQPLPPRVVDLDV